MSRNIEIKKEDGRWKVIRDNRNEKIKRNEDVTWVLLDDPDDTGDRKVPISAHFQFTDRDLVENQKGSGQLTDDWTAVIPEPGNKLHLKVKGAACRRRNPRHYAVWIADYKLPAGGVFAVGEDGNPPPEMDVGGGP